MLLDSEFAIVRPMVSPTTRDSDTVDTEYWSALDDGRVLCEVCPRACKLHEGQRGLCFVRARQRDRVVLTTYGRSSGFCVDPIEKKPLNHFLRGTPVLSFGTAGCNLTCRFCQNWDISKSREVDTLADVASPERIAKSAVRYGCRSVAFTYNDPIIFLEYARDVAAACKEEGLRTVAVTAGYVNAKPRADFFSFIDAANVDLKAFDEQFYRKIVGGKLQTVLETLRYLKREASTWFEITTLLIPGYNDTEKEIGAMSNWILRNLGSDVPLHFSAFHPDYKMRQIAPTPKRTLDRARLIARAAGLHHVYTGNVRDRDGDTTFCSACERPLIVRDWYEVLRWRLVDGACPDCGTPCPGVFENRPGRWGASRMPVRLRSESDRA